MIFDLNGPMIIGAWKRLIGLIDVQREAFGDDSLWSNFEYLYRGAKAWDDAHFPETDSGDAAAN